MSSKLLQKIWWSSCLPVSLVLLRREMAFLLRLAARSKNLKHKYFDAVVFLFYRSNVLRYFNDFLSRAVACSLENLNPCLTGDWNHSCLSPFLIITTRSAIHDIDKLVFTRLGETSSARRSQARCDHFPYDQHPSADVRANVHSTIQTYFTFVTTNVAAQSTETKVELSEVHVFINFITAEAVLWRAFKQWREEQ